MKYNLDFRRVSDDEMDRNGWAAWSRDPDGPLCTAHAPFDSVTEMQTYTEEEKARGYTVFLPPGELRLAHDSKRT